MRKSTRDDAGEEVPVAGANERGGRTLIAKTVESGDGHTECTIYPVSVPQEERLTTWITAREGSFVDLDARR